MAAERPQQTAGRLVAVVVTHDRPDQLRQAVAALLASPPGELAAILVVDNASGPDTAAWLAANPDPRVHVLTLERNTGGAGGFAAGMRHALLTLHPDWLMVMDDDAFPEPGALAEFHRLDRGSWQAFAAAVRHPDGTICEMNRPTLNPFLRPAVLFRTLTGRGRDAFHLSEPDYQEPGLQEVDGASFVGLFLSRKVLDRMGFPDPRLFLYADDAIYTLGMTRAGFRLAFAPMVRFWHDSGTFTRAEPRIRPLWKVYYYHRNLILLYRQVSGWLFWPVMLYYIPRWSLRLWYHRGERRVFLRLFARAIRDGLGQRLDLSHDEVLAMAGQPAPAPRGRG